jgi:DNA-binding transcriptional MerR regulator
LLFTIGQVTKMYNISHDTLRYYDKIDLLKPSVKKENGYRYYTIREIELLEIILIAKQLEIPIKAIKDIVQKEDIDAYVELFTRHEKFLEDKIKYLTDLKYRVKISKDMASKMSEFKNKEIKDEFKSEYINKKVIFFNQNGNSYIGTVVKTKNLMILLNKDDKGNIVGDTSRVGIEVFEDEIFEYKNYTDYTEKNFKGDYIVITRKDTLSNISKLTKEILNNINYNDKKVEVLLETMFTLSRKEKENIYLVKLYIPKN